MESSKILNLILNKEYKTIGGYKVLITSIEETQQKPYLGTLFHAQGKGVISYYGNLTNGDIKFDIISEWDNSELAILYKKEVPFEKMGSIPENLKGIIQAVEYNKDKWFIDENGNKYQGSKTWNDILELRMKK